MKNIKLLSFLLFVLSFTSGSESKPGLPDMPDLVAFGIAKHLDPADTAALAAVDKNTLDPEAQQYAFRDNPIANFVEKFKEEENPILNPRAKVCTYDRFLRILDFSILGVKYRIYFEPRTIEKEIPDIDPNNQDQIAISKIRIPALMALPKIRFDILISIPTVGNFEIELKKFSVHDKFDAIELFEKLAEFKEEMVELLKSDYPDKTFWTKAKEAEYLKLFEDKVKQATCTEVWVINKA